MKRIILNIFVLSLLAVLSVNAFSESRAEIIHGSAGSVIVAEDFGTFNEPWAMTFLPTGELLVTEKPGNLYLYDTQTQTRKPVSGVPSIAYGGQGGLGDIILHPDFENNNILYLSYAESELFGRSGAAVAKAKLNINNSDVSLDDLDVIWLQEPKVRGSGHYSHRLAFSPDGFLFITSGERQKQQPAQDWSQSLGKIIRLNEDGSVPRDNPFQDKGKLAKTFWTLGHRNMLGIDFDSSGQLWVHEMGPRHGDELNLIKKGENYGWPEVSWGNQYSGADIPDHDTRPEFHAPEEYWVPSIAPSGLILYDGDLFSSWHDNAIIGGLVSKALIRVKTDGAKASEVERFDMKNRIREVEQGPDGAVWILEDRAGARLRRLSPQ